MQKLLLFLALASCLLAVSCGSGSSTTIVNQTPASGGQATLQSIKITPTSAAVAPGTTQAFAASAAYSDGSTKDVTPLVQWACPGSSLVTVSNTAPTQGLVTASQQPGNVVVSASLGVITQSAVLTIKNVSLTSLLVNPATASIGWGNPQQFTATAVFSDLSQQDVTNITSWGSYPPFITSNSGLVIGQGLGSGSVSAFFGFQSANASLTVDLSNLTSISISPATPTIANKTKLQLEAVGTFTDGSTRDITSLVSWSASNGSIATFSFSTSGLLTASNPGSTTVTATAIVNETTGATLSGSTNLSVTGATLSSIFLYPPNPSLAMGTKLSLTAIGVFSDSSAQDLTSQVSWGLSNYQSASVSGSGEVTGVTPATGVNLTAYSPSSLGVAQGVTQINVTAATLSSIAITPANPIISPGATISFDAVGTFSDGTTQDLTSGSSWSSTLKNVATVKAQVATAQGIGQTEVSAKSGSSKGTTALTVAAPQQISLALSVAKLQIAQQTSVQLNVQGTFGTDPAQGMTTIVNWTSSSPTVATVGLQTGVVTGLAPGQSTITATLGSVAVSLPVTVTSASLNSITVSPSNDSVKLGATEQLTATGNLSDGSSEILVGPSWSSSNAGVVFVDGSGLAHTTGAGTAKITATANGVSGSTSLTIQ